jgi:hypothetical protein
MVLPAPGCGHCAWIEGEEVKRKDDPKREKLRAERNRTELRLGVLSAGIGKAFVDYGGGRYAADELRPVIDLVNGELMEAIKHAESAEKAYEPYWSRRRIHRIRRAAPQKKAKKVKQALEKVG